MKKIPEESKKTASDSGEAFDKNVISTLVQKFRQKASEIDEIETFSVSLQKEISGIEKIVSPKDTTTLATLESKRTQLSMVPGFLRKLNTEAEKLTADIQEALPRIRAYAEATLRTRYDEVIASQTEALLKFWPNRGTARQMALQTPAVGAEGAKLSSLSLMENDDPISQAERILEFLNGGMEAT